MKVKDLIEKLKTLNQEQDIAIMVPEFDGNGNIIDGAVMIDALDNPLLARDVAKTKYTERTHGKQIFGYVEEQPIPMSYNNIYIINPFNY